MRRVQRLFSQICASAADAVPPGARPIEFTATTELGQGTTLRGLLFEPEGTGRVPCVVMAHGFSCTYRMSLVATAAAYREAGFAALVYDHRTFGESDGQPRHQVDFWAQLAGYKDAIGFAAQQPRVDPARIAVWGMSLSGGLALSVAAIDDRVKAVVSLVPVAARPQNEAGELLPPDRAKFDSFVRLAAGEAAKAEVTAIGPLPVCGSTQVGGQKQWFGGGVVFCEKQTTPENGLASANGYFIKHGQKQNGGNWLNQATRIARKTEVPGAVTPVLQFQSKPALLFASRTDELVPFDQVKAGFAAMPAAAMSRFEECDGGHFGLLQTDIESDDPKLGKHSQIWRDGMAKQIDFLKLKL